MHSHWQDIASWTSTFFMKQIKNKKTCQIKIKYVSETLAFPQAVTRRELRYVSYLEICPFAVMLCLSELKKKVAFLPEGGKEKTMYCHGVGDHNGQRRTLFSERDRNPR